MIAEMIRQWQALVNDESYDDADEMVDEIFAALVEMVSEFPELSQTDRETLLLTRFNLI